MNYPPFDSVDPRAALLRVLGGFGGAGQLFGHAAGVVGGGSLPPVAQAAGPAAPPMLPHPAGGGPQGDPGGSGLAPPFPGAVVAVYDQGRPLYYGTPEWARYQLMHGLGPQPHLGADTGQLQGAMSPLVQALLSRFRQPAAAAGGLGHGPVIG